MEGAFVNDKLDLVTKTITKSIYDCYVTEIFLFFLIQKFFFLILSIFNSILGYYCFEDSLTDSIISNRMQVLVM